MPLWKRQRRQHRVSTLQYTMNPTGMIHIHEQERRPFNDTIAEVRHGDCKSRCGDVDKEVENCEGRNEVEVSFALDSFLVGVCQG